MKQTAIDKVIMSKRIESVKEHAKTRKAMKNAEKKVKGAIMQQGKQKKLEMCIRIQRNNERLLLF